MTIYVFVVFAYLILIILIELLISDLFLSFSFIITNLINIYVDVPPLVRLNVFVIGDTYVSLLDKVIAWSVLYVKALKALLTLLAVRF